MHIGVVLRKKINLNIFLNTCVALDGCISLHHNHTEKMTTAKQVILTAIKFKGLEQVKSESADLSEKAICSEAYVLSLIKKVERKIIVIG